MRRFFVPIRGVVSERGKIMMMNMLYVFNDINGRIVFKPFDVFEKHANNDKSDYVRFTR